MKRSSSNCQTPNASQGTNAHECRWLHVKWLRCRDPWTTLPWRCCKRRQSWGKRVRGLWSELPPTGQRREVGAAEAAAPAAKSARVSSKQRPQLTTPWRREALGARPPPGTNSPTANKRQPGESKGGTPKQTTQAKPKGKPTKTWPPKGPQEGANENVTTSREGHKGETKASKVARPSKRVQPPLTGTRQSRLTVAPQSANFAPK